uniref:Aspartyl/asparaginyl beta-hydroxylase n=1 Tax=Canis lupus familiaris TaxID=9615 RepID=A0A8C0Z1N4_CANLF
MGLLPTSSFQTRLRINADEKRSPSAGSRAAFPGLQGTAKRDSNGVPRARPAGPALRASRPRVRRPRPRAPPQPPGAPRLRQRSREPSWLPRLPRSQGPRQTGKVDGGSRSQAAAARPEQPRVRRGAGKHGRAPPPLGAVVIGPPSRHSAFRGRGEAGLGREGAWPRGLRAARSRPGRESRVRRTPGLGARSRHAGESPRRRGGRSRDPGAAAGARPAPAAAPAADSAPRPREGAPGPRRPSRARHGPAQERQGRRRRRQQQQRLGQRQRQRQRRQQQLGQRQRGRGHQRRQQQPRGAERSGQRRGGGVGPGGGTGAGVPGARRASPPPSLRPPSARRVAPPWGAGRRPRSVGPAGAPRGRAELGARPWVGRTGPFPADPSPQGGPAGRETKHGGHKNGRKGGLSGSSFFTWFMVIALLGVWTSVAVVWFDLVDYEEVLGPQNTEDEVQEVQIESLLHEAVYTEHGDDVQQEEDGQVREPQPEDDFLVGSDTDDRYEPLETGTFHEETEDSYHIEETASQAYNQDMEEMMYEQDNPDSMEPIVGDDARTYHEADDLTYQDYDEPVYEPPENEGLESSDNAGEDSNIILEEVYMPPAEEQQEVPPVKKKKPKLLNKFDKTIKAELDAAEKLRKRGKIEEALSAFQELVRKYPQSPRARYGKAQCEDDLAEKRRSNEVLRGAIETYQEVASLPNVPTDLLKLTLKRRSDRQQFLGHMRGSLITLQKLVQLFPDDMSLKNDLGVGYLLIGDNNNAQKVYEEVLNVTPNDGFAKVHYGFILKAQNKIAESIPYLKEGIESGDPGTDDGRFYFHLGDAMQRVGNKEAYKWYELGHKRGHFASVWQRSLYNVHGLKAQPWWTPKETGYTELVKSLERNWKLIRDEGLAVMDKAKGLFLPEDENLREKGDWSQFTLWQQGRKNENACKGAPKTCSLLDKFPETTGCRRGQIKYSIMHPGTHVWPHTGPTNCRLRMHLGLVIPKEGCKIRCANETKTWEEGKVLIFDDSFEHEVWQDATSFRLIFIVDVWHPELTPQQRHSLPAI